MLESIPKKQKLQIYRFDPVSKVLTHLYLGFLKHLLYVGMHGQSLFRIYLSPNSQKLSLENPPNQSSPYTTKSGPVDFTVKYNQIRQNNTFLKSKTVEFSVQSKPQDAGPANPSQMYARQPSYRMQSPGDSLFCKSLLGSPFSYANRPSNLSLMFFSPHRVNFKKSMLDPKWKLLKFFCEQNCPRIIGIQPDILLLKKWGFPCLAPEISDCVIIPQNGSHLQENSETGAHLVFLEFVSGSPMIKVNFLRLNSRRHSTREKSLFTLEKIGRLNKSSQLKSFHQVNGEHAQTSPGDWPVEPKISKHSVFTGRIWKNQSKLVQVQEHVFLSVLLKNSTTHRKELKFFHLDHNEACIKPITWSCLFVLSNTNRGSSRTQYDFSVVKAPDFPPSER